MQWNRVNLEWLVRLPVLIWNDKFNIIGKYLSNRANRGGMKNAIDFEIYWSMRQMQIWNVLNAKFLEGEFSEG